MHKQILIGKCERRDCLQNVRADAINKLKRVAKNRPMFGAYPVTRAWRVLQVLKEETVSRYRG
jgi:hypothetical protein